MHVQKFVYLSHGFYLASEGESLVEDPFEAWSFGPVVRRLYDALKKWGSEAIPKLVEWGDDSPFGYVQTGQVAKEVMSNTETNVIQEVWETYGTFPAFQLSALTHADGTPWQKVFIPGKNVRIPNFWIAEYFKSL